MHEAVAVLDSSAHSSELICHVLRHCGFCATDAGDREAALSLLRTAPQSAILVSLDDSAFNGFVLMSEIRRLPLQAKAVVLALSSAQDDAALKGLARQSGARGWITKPIRPRSMVDSLSALLLANAVQDA